MKKKFWNKKNKDMDEQEENQETKPKTCALCLLSIKPDDNYVRLTDYFKGKWLDERFYHTKCYTDRLKGTEELKAMKSKAWDVLNRVGGMLPKKEKEVEFSIP